MENTLLGHSDAGGYRALMHIQSATALDDPVHLSPFGRLAAGRRLLGASSAKIIWCACSRATVWGAQEAPASHFFTGFVRHQAPSTSSVRRQLHFHAVGVARPGPWGTFLK